jgi:type I restriction enzyme, S subunit
MRAVNDLAYVRRGRSRHRPRNEPALYGGEYPFVQTADVHAADLYITNYSQTYSEKGLQQSRLWESGTICITIAGENTGDCAILGIHACFPDSVVGVVPGPTKADTTFLKYAIDRLRPQLRNITRGATQDNLSVAKLLAFKFPSPPVTTQRMIGEILRNYGDLIDNNRRRIAHLEEAARQLYCEWFVRLRFPGHEHTRISDGAPEGWETRSMLNHPLFEFVSDNIGRYDGLKRYYATADIDGIHIVGDGIECAFEEKPSRAQKVPEVASVWFARMQYTYKVLVFTNANASLASRSMLSSGFAGFGMCQRL